MKAINLFLLFYFISMYTSNAQVGIGTTNPEATLDIRSSNQATPANTDGILIPKINNFPTTNPTAAKDGMLVYATGSGTPTKGFYYWDQAITNWVAINNNSGWQETGNVGTNPTINFIGTTDAQDLSFRINNVEKIRLTQQGQLEFLNTGNSVFIGEGAGERIPGVTNPSNTFVGSFSGNSNVSGSRNSFFGAFSGFNNFAGGNNSFFGTSSGYNNTSGYFNSFFGYSSGSNNRTGDRNSFFGTSSGSHNNNGRSNTFIGYFAGIRNTDGNENTALGSSALSNNLIGNSNVAIGTFAGQGSIGNSKSGGVFIGYEAGMNEDNSNRLYIQNSSSVNPLIYGEFDTNILRVNGTLQVSNPIAAGYAFPNADGTANQTLQTDGNGAISFVDASVLDTNAWSRTGNTGTNTATNFIGTTDAQDVSFRTNNFEKMRLTQQGQLEFLNTGSSVFIGQDAGTNDDLTSNANTYVGDSSGSDNISGTFNVAIGNGALFGNRGGSDNVAIGAFSLNQVFSGNRNVAIGRFAGGNSGVSKNNCIFIGYRAGFNEDTDNRLYIENSLSANPLIYGEFENDILRVNGELQVNDPTVLGYAFPNVDGTNNQVFQTDGNGLVSFVDTNTLDTNDWSRNGNTGTNSGTNFIGTTDAQDVSFRTNNIEKMRLTQKGQLEFLNTGNSVFIGENAGTFDNLTDNYNTYVGYFSGRNPNTTSEYNSYFGSFAGEETVGFFNSYFGSFAGNLAGGDNNTYIGYRAGANAGGSYSTFIGSRAGEATNDNTVSNVFIGADSASNFSQGDENVAIGNLTIQSAFGNGNVVIGSRALQFSADTNNSVVIGAQAAENVGGIGGSIVIGNQAGQSLSVIAEKLIIHNSDSAFPLIYGEFDNRILALNGDVAIGHQAPQAPLHVKGFGNPNTQDVVGVLESSDTSRPILLFSESPTINLNAGMSLEYNGTGNNTTNKLVFNGIGGNGLFEFQNGGDLNVLSGDLTTLTGDIIIGTTTGDRELRMGDTAGNNDRVMLRQAGTDHIFVGDIDNNGGNFTIRTGGVNAVTVLSGSRNVGIGITTPTNQLQLSTNAAGKPTSGLWTITSDRRLKKDVSPFSDGLETLKKIDPVWFTYNGLADMPIETGVGTIAQDLQEVAPYLIKDWKYTDEDGTTENYLGVNYGPLTFIMVNAIKEQSVEIEELKTALTNLQEIHTAEITLLEARLERLEN